MISKVHRLLLMGVLCAWPLAARATTGSVVWLDDHPDPTLAPSLQIVPPAEIAPDLRLNATDKAALHRLRTEIDALRPLVDEFDGELKIMAGLQATIADVGVLRGADDRAILFEALALQGFAVQRYFQDSLATDPAAGPYRRVVGGAVEVAAWADAVALEPEHIPVEQDVREAPERAALDATRARLLSAPKATIRLGDLPRNAVISVDGRQLAVSAWAGGPLRVVPGTHRIAVMIDGAIRVRHRARLDPDEELVIEPTVTPETLAELADALKFSPADVHLPRFLVGALSRLPEPIVVAVHNGDEPVLYELAGPRLVRVAIDDVRLRPPEPERRTAARIDLWVGGALLEDPSYLRLRSDSDPSVHTATAAGVGTGASVGVPIGRAAAGVGVDVLVPTGAGHVLPLSTGGRVRARTHAWAFVGAPRARLTAGVLLPWHAAFGGRWSIRFNDVFGLEAGTVIGVPVARPQLDGGAYAPGFVWWSFVGLATRLELTRRR